MRIKLFHECTDVNPEPPFLSKLEGRINDWLEKNDVTILSIVHIPKLTRLDCHVTVLITYEEKNTEHLADLIDSWLLANTNLDMNKIVDLKEYIKGQVK